jgi:hypothetical protein
MTINYTTGIPTAAQSLGITQQPIQNNFSVINTAFAVDHVAFNNPNAGYHNVIHIPNQTIASQSTWNPVIGSGVPAAIQTTKIAGVQQTFAMNYQPNFTGSSVDTQLFTMTGGGGISQLSGNSAASEGWVWNGMLFQWGAITGKSGAWPGSPTALTFKDRKINGSGPNSTGIPFPNSCFVVLTTLIGPTSSSTGDLIVTAKSATSFSWQFSGSGSSSFDGFYWLAIGN